MSVTPQTNADLPAIAQALAERDDVVISGHVSPDGDCLGSQLVLAHAARHAHRRSCRKDRRHDRHVQPVNPFT